MSIALSVTSDVKPLLAGLNRMQRAEVPKAVNTVLNRTLANADTAASKRLAPYLTLTQASVKARVSKKKSTWRTLVARMTATHEPVNLAEFKSRQVRSGVSAAAYGKRKIYKGAFLNNGKAYAREGKERLPIKALWGPSITQAWADLDIDDTVRQTLAQRFPGHFRTALQSRLRGYGRRVSRRQSRALARQGQALIRSLL